MRILWESGDSRTWAVRRELGDDVLEDLLTGSFPGRTALRVRALTPGFSGASVLHVLPERDGAQHPCVVKIGPTAAIEDEYDRWKEYVQPYLGNGEMPDVLSPPAEQVHGRSAVVYKFYASTTLADRLAELDRAEDGRGVAELLTSLLQILAVLHQSRLSTYLDLFVDEYHLDETAFDGFETLAGRAWVYGPVDDAHLVRRVWQQPPEALSVAQLSSNCHGDLHSGNVLVGPAGSLGIIDFEHTGKHHYLRDFATLEADLVLRVLCPEDLKVAEAGDLVAMLLPYYSIEDFAPWTDGDADWEAARRAEEVGRGLFPGRRILIRFGMGNIDETLLVRPRGPADRYATGYAHADDPRGFGDRLLARELGTWWPGWPTRRERTVGTGRQRRRRGLRPRHRA